VLDEVKELTCSSLKKLVDMLSQHFSGRTKENHETHKPALAEI
jgi:hypothetical protein